jgi:hypothetical protein
MTQIDEKAFAEAIETHYPKWGGNEIYHYRNVVEAYETAKAPRTISAEELTGVEVAFIDSLNEHGGWDNFIIDKALEKCLATLGITVREV